MSRHAHPLQPSGSLVTQCPPTGVPHELTADVADLAALTVAVAATGSAAARATAAAGSAIHARAAGGSSVSGRTARAASAACTASGAGAASALATAASAAPAAPPSPHRLSVSAGASRTRRITGRARRIASSREQNDPTQKNRGAMRAGLHLMSHATLAAVQNLPDVFPDMPVWQSGSVGSRHALLSAHIVVHAANIVGLLMQLKQVVPAPQGCPQSGTNVVHLPCRQVTPAWSVNRRREPSSAVGCPAAQPQRG